MYIQVKLMNAKHLHKVYCHTLPKHQNSPSSPLMLLVFGQRMTVTVKNIIPPPMNLDLYLYSITINCNRIRISPRLATSQGCNQYSTSVTKNTIKY